MKGITTAGVANIETLFRQVVYVATGSGIGPCLPHLLAAQVPARLVWATRDPGRPTATPWSTRSSPPSPTRRPWDTARDGKPDMLRLAYAGYREFGAEAVICISNKQLTWQVVRGLEERGVPGVRRHLGFLTTWRPTMEASPWRTGRTRGWGHGPVCAGRRCSTR